MDRRRNTVVADDRFSSARTLLRWAREDIQDLDLKAEAFLRSAPYAPFIEPDPETGNVFFKVRMTQVPDEISKLASHALWDIKHALDHATCSAVRAIYGSGIGDIHFPVASHPNDLQAKLRHVPKGQVNPKYPVELHNLFGSFEPYPTSNKYVGGGDEFIALSKLANSTKHSVSLGAAARSHLAGAEGIGGIIKLYLDWWDRSKQELTLGLFQAGTTVDMKVQLACFLSFSDIEVLQPHPAGEILAGYAACTESIVDALEAAVS